MTKFNLGWPHKPPKNKSLQPVLHGFRLTLSFPCAEDYPAWSLVRAKNQDDLTPFEPQWPQDCLTRAFFLRRLQRQERDYQSGAGAFFLIRHKQSGSIIGGINLNNIQMGAACSATLGYWLDRDSQRQGYMSEAARLVINFSFNVLKLHRLNAACLPDNQPSVKLLHRLGFTEEGFAKEYLQINGIWQDHRLFGLLSPSRDM